MPNRTATAESPRAGLVAGTESIPLEGVSVRADLSDFSARVVVTQRYRNVEDRPIEAVYTFPLDEQAAVCGFEAIVGDVHYVGEVQTREQAFKTYDDALQEGHGAYLLDEERPDVFIASVGNIPPGGDVLVRITYVSELVAEGDAIRFTLPTTVAPRYAPAADRTGVGRPDAETLNPPLMWEVPYGLDLAIRIATPGAITAVQSPSHPIAVALDGTDATVTLAQSSAALDRDVVVLIEAKDLHAPHARIERDEDGRITAALAVRPMFERADAPVEVIFVVDRSGSMNGSSIAEVRNALQLCLRSLTVGCRFNIIGFGSNYASLFDTSREYGDETLAIASAHVKSLEADLGGTEILGALTFALAQPAVAGLPRNLVILTDGEVTNTDAVLAEVASHRGGTRVFMFGIGRGASAHLVRGLARAGRGVAEFLYPGERIEAKVLRQFGRLLSPALSDVKITWGDLAATPVVADLPPVFAGERLVTYAFVKDVHPSTISISARGPQGDMSWSAAVTGNDVVAGRVLATLAARRRIRELEEHPDTLTRFGSKQPGRTGGAVRDEIIRLATTYGLASRETSFVAIERREGAVPTELTLRRIPVALTSGWGGLARPFSGTRLSGASLLAASAAIAQFDSIPDFADSSSAPPMPEASASHPTGIVRRVFSRLTGREAAKPVAPAPPRRPLDELVALQRANGSWNLNEELAERIGTPLDLLRAGRPDVSWVLVSESAWATLLALAWLEMHAADEHDEWMPLARKANAWLALTVRAPELEAARTAARAVIVPK